MSDIGRGAGQGLGFGLGCLALLIGLPLGLIVLGQIAKSGDYLIAVVAILIIGAIYVAKNRKEIP